MKLKNSADDDQTVDELIAMLESAGVSLSDKDKEVIKKTRQHERYMRESLPAEQQLRHLCRLGRSGRGLVERSLVAYLAVCRKNASKPRRKNGIDTRAIYAARR